MPYDFFFICKSKTHYLDLVRPQNCVIGLIYYTLVSLVCENGDKNTLVIFPSYFSGNPVISLPWHHFMIPWVLKIHYPQFRY